MKSSAPGNSSQKVGAASSSPALSRRQFLVTLSSGGALAAVPAGAVVPLTPAATPAADADGYRDTPHIRNYYRTTRL